MTGEHLPYKPNGRKKNKGKHNWNRGKIITHIFSMKIDEIMVELIDWLISQCKIFSRSEFMRFAVQIYLYDAINPLMYENQYFPREYYVKHKGRRRTYPKRRMISAKFQLPLLQDLDKLVTQYRKEGIDRSTLVRQAIDNCIPYFLNLTDIKQGKLPIILK